jgi:hypothetical protein
MKKEKQLYGQEFSSKERLIKWIEEKYDKIDWNYCVWLEWYYKEEDEE